MRELDQKYPWYAPGRFLKTEYQTALAMEPRLLQQSAFRLANEKGEPVVVEISAVLVPVSKTRASIMFVDNRVRIVYGQLYVNEYGQGDFVNRFVDDVLAAMRAAYQKEAENSLRQGRALPAASETLQKMKDVIGSKVQGVQNQS